MKNQNKDLTMNDSSVNSPVIPNPQGKVVPVKEDPSFSSLEPAFKQEVVQAGGIDSLIQSTCGCKKQDVSQDLYVKCVQACAGGSEDVDLTKEMPTILHAIGEMAPQDVVESALITSFWALHSRGMKMLSSSSYAVNANLATKLIRTSHETLEALLKWRRRGEQRIVIQHVNVEGSVGNLVAGGGVVAKLESSPQPTGGIIDASQT